jgi:hypothetical protein
MIMRRFTIPYLKFFMLVVAVCLSCLFAYAATDPVHFVAIGDMGCGCPAQAAVAREMLEWYQQKRFAFVLTTGDNIYGDNYSRFWNRRRGGNKNLFYEQFDRYYNPLRNRGVPFFATLGNHDLETRNGQDLINDRKRFNILSKTGYYHFSPDPKLVQFIALNTEGFVYENERTEQLKWLQDVLSNSRSLWKIVYGHRPFYSPPGSHAIPESLKRLLEPVMVRNGVKVYIAGHNHFYARMKPQRGIIHFTTGGGGRHLKTPVRTPETDVIARAYHFMHFEVSEAELKYWAIPVDGPLLDHGRIRISIE